jgi:hypothetical protein
MKIAFMLAPEHSVEAIFGLLSLLQALISFVAFGQPVSPGSLAGAVMQTYGYFLIAGSCAGEELSVRRGLHPFFGAMPEFAGVFFAVVALVLQVISLTMVEALSGNVKLTVGELCRGNGFMGFAITAAYHGFVLGTKTERYVVLVPPTDATWLAVSFVVAAAVQQYAQSWLVLRTRAVEYARTAMFASLVLFAIRHSVYREDGAAYGFYQIPPFGGMLTLAGFVLISLEASGGGTKRVDPSLQVPEA